MKKRSKAGQETTLRERVVRSLEERGLAAYLFEKPLVVGVSGGADSLALLRILMELRGPAAHETIHVAHLNHSFRGKQSEEDALYVAALCRNWGVACTLSTFDVSAYASRAKLSQEDAARRVRYAFLGSVAIRLDAAVAVAHTADDQAETVLMNILRGSGLTGLGGMRWLSPLPPTANEKELLPLAGETQPDGPVELFRPLLGVWRSEIEAYCSTHGVVPRTDETNDDTKYLRNRVRRHLIPLLETQYNSAAREHLVSLAEASSTEDSAMEALAMEIWRSAAVEVPGEGVSRVDVMRLGAIPDALRLRVARHFLREVAGSLEGFDRYHFKQVALALSPDIIPGFKADLPQGISVERVGSIARLLKRGEGYPISPVEPASPWPLIAAEKILPLTPGTTLEMESNWRLVISEEELSVRPVDNTNLIARFDADSLGPTNMLTIRTRRPGDYIEQYGMTGRRSLQDLFVDAKIPWHVRANVALLAFANGSEVLWVPGPGGRRSRRALVSDHTRRVIKLSFESNISK